jgi:hypothetical protein
MSANPSFPIAATAILIAAILFSHSAVAQKAPTPPLEDQLKAQMKLTRMKSDSGGLAVIEAGTVYVVQKGGILGVPPANPNVAPSTYENGKLHAPSGYAKSLVGATTYEFQVGDKVYVIRIKVQPQADKVAVSIVHCDSCSGAQQPSSFHSQIVFLFPKGYLATAEVDQIEEVINQVLAVDNPITEAPENPQTSAGQGLTNDDIVKLVQAKLPDSVVLAKIKSSNCDFDTSPDALIKLKRAGVSDSVLQAIVEAPPPSNQPDAAGPGPADSSMPGCSDYASCLKSGGAAFQSAQWDQALAFFQRAASLEPTKPAPWGFMGAVYLATGQYQEVPAAGDKSLSLGGPLGIMVCHERTLQPCEQGTFSLGPKEISFTGPTGQKLFAAAPSQVAAKGSYNFSNSGRTYFRIQVAGKNYNFDPIVFGVTCTMELYVQCPPQGIDQQAVVANYVSQTIPRLASGSLGSSPP